MYLLSQDDQVLVFSKNSQKFYLRKTPLYMYVNYYSFSFEFGKLNFNMFFIDFGYMPIQVIFINFKNYKFLNFLPVLLKYCTLENKELKTVTTASSIFFIYYFKIIYYIRKNTEEFVLSPFNFFYS